MRGPGVSTPTRFSGDRSRIRSPAAGYAPQAPAPHAPPSGACSRIRAWCAAASPGPQFVRARRASAPPTRRLRAAQSGAGWQIARFAPGASDRRDPTARGTAPDASREPTPSKSWLRRRAGATTEAAWQSVSLRLIGGFHSWQIRPDGDQAGLARWLQRTGKRRAPGAHTHDRGVNSKEVER
jgi:hypothetical protein